MSSLPDRVLHFFSQMPVKPRLLLVAVSGGGDSVALFQLLKILRVPLGIDRLAIAHVNHGLRAEESDADEQMVRELAKTFAVESFVCTNRQQQPARTNLEAWARECRYEYFQKIKKREGFDAVATGHTADDQAETVLLRMMRGCGLSGLRGIHAFRDDFVVRPLIGCRRAELRSWLNDSGFFFREDSSNSSTRFQRNSIRIELLPRLVEIEPKIVEKLCSIAECAERCAPVIGESARQWIGHAVTRSKTSTIILKESLLREDADDGLVALMYSLDIVPDHHHVQQIIQAANKHAGRLLLPQGWRCVVRKTDIVLFRLKDALEANTDATPLVIPGTTHCLPDVSITITKLDTPQEVGPFDPTNRTLFLDVKSIGESLVYRSCTPQERFHPVGALRDTTIGSFLKSQRIDAFMRARTRVIARSDGMIIAIPGVRISQNAAVGPSTRKILRIFIDSII